MVRVNFVKVVDPLAYVDILSFSETITITTIYALEVECVDVDRESSSIYNQFLFTKWHCMHSAREFVIIKRKGN